MSAAGSEGRARTLSARPPAISPEVARRAVEWLVTLQSAEADGRTRADWRRWLEAHPDHARAWRHIESFNGQLREVASPLASAVARAALAAPGSPRRRHAVRALALLFAGGGAAWLAREQAPLQGWLADLHTGVGERRTVRLEDGTALVLNTDSAVDVHYGSAGRVVRLLRGEILVSTARDRQVPARPMLVETRQGRLLPLGTRFAVRQFEDSSWVGVLEGTVAVEPLGGAGGGPVLAAGEQVRFGRDGAEPAAPLADTAVAWTDGMLVASAMRLEDFLAELGRYRPGRLRCDPAVAGLRVSGTYPLADTGRVLDLLRTTLPVRIHFVTRYWVTVLPAPA